MSRNRKSTLAAWKKFQRDTAVLFGIERNEYNLKKGLEEPDIDLGEYFKGEILVIECKNTQTLSPRKALEQCRKYRPSSICVVAYKPSAGKRGDKMYITFYDMIRLVFGSLPRKAGYNSIVCLSLKGFSELYLKVVSRQNRS